MTRILSICLMVSAILVSFTPVSAVADIASCTDEERFAVALVAAEFITDLEAVSQDLANPDSTQLAEIAERMNQLQVNWWEDTYVLFPRCAEVLDLGSEIGYLLDDFVAVFATVRSGDYELVDRMMRNIDLGAFEEVTQRIQTSLASVPECSTILLSAVVPTIQDIRGELDVIYAIPQYQSQDRLTAWFDLQTKWRNELAPQLPNCDSALDGAFIINRMINEGLIAAAFRRSGQLELMDQHLGTFAIYEGSFNAIYESVFGPMIPAQPYLS
jgi:hypothetical protein